MYLFCGSKASFGTTPVAMKLLFSRINEERKFKFIVTTPKCFCLYRLKCSKAISGWDEMDGIASLNAPML